MIMIFWTSITVALIRHALLGGTIFWTWPAQLWLLLTLYPFIFFRQFAHVLFSFGISKRVKHINFYLLMRFPTLAGFLLRKSLLYPFSWIISRIYYWRYDLDLWTFSFIAYTVYYWLCRRGRQRKLEGTFSDWTFWSMLSVGVKAGGIVAGFLDVGRALAPANLRSSSLVADLLRCVAEFVKGAYKLPDDDTIPSPPVKLEAVHIANVPRRRPGFFSRLWARVLDRPDPLRIYESTAPLLPVEETEAIDRVALVKDELDDDMKELNNIHSWYSVGLALQRNIMQTLRKHSWRFAWFFAAVITGVVVYCWQHNKTALESVLLETDEEAIKRGQKGGNSAKKYKQRGKAAHRGNGPTRAVTGSKAFWAYYDPQDVENIIEVFHNGDPVDRSRVAVGQHLDDGTWAITRKVGQTLVIDEFTVGGARSRHVGSHGDNADLKQLGSHGGKTKMTISGKRGGDLAESLEGAVEVRDIYQNCNFWHACGKASDVDAIHQWFDEDCTDGCDGMVTYYYTWRPLDNAPPNQLPILHVDAYDNVEVKEPKRGPQPLPPPKEMVVPNKPLPKPPKTAPSVASLTLLLEDNARMIKELDQALAAATANIKAQKVPPPIPPKPKRPIKETEPIANVGGKQLPPTEGRTQWVESKQARRPLSGQGTKDQASSDAAMKKLEALVASSPKVDIGPAKDAMIDVLDKDGKRISGALTAWCGIIVNAHAYTAGTHFRSNGKTIEKTKLAYETSNKDIRVCQFFDGCPKPLSKKYFECPETSQAVFLIDQSGKIARGLVMSTDEQGTHGLQARATYSSEPGDCGGPVINTNGSVVGIHFSAGKPKVDNLFYPVCDSLLKLVPKNSYVPSQLGK